MRSGFLALAALLAATAPAFAQNTEQPAAPAPAPAAAPNPAQRFEAYATSDGYKKSIGQIAVMGSAIHHPECKDHKAVKRAALTIYAPPLFAEGVHPVNGLWLDRIQMDVCGKTAYENILVQGQPGTTPKAALKMPGQTSANPPMQDLVLKDIVDALATKKCTDLAQIIPVDSVAGKETKKRKVDQRGVLVEGAWKETWTVRACGKTVSATVDFTTDGKGGLTHKVKL